MANEQLIANDGHFTTVTDENGLLLASYDFTTADDAQAAAEMVQIIFSKCSGKNPLKALNIFDCSPKLAATTFKQA